MSSTIIAVFSWGAFDHLAAVLILVFPDIIHFLHLQYLHHENHNKLYRTGKEKQETDIRVLLLRRVWLGQTLTIIPSGFDFKKMSVLTRNQ